jgi:hypothetical protein
MLALLNNTLPVLSSAIKSCSLIDLNVARDERGALELVLENGYRIVLTDIAGQSCCEHRYMHTDDDLTSLVGESLQRIWVGEFTEQGGDYGDTLEGAFIHIQTNRDAVVIAIYNSHNGYYGGLEPGVSIFDADGVELVHEQPLA